MPSTRTTAFICSAAALALTGCINLSAQRPASETPCVVVPHTAPLPEVVSVPRSKCPYALCLDAANYAALRAKLDQLAREAGRAP